MGLATVQDRVPAFSNYTLQLETQAHGENDTSF